MSGFQKPAPPYRLTPEGVCVQSIAKEGPLQDKVVSIEARREPISAKDFRISAWELEWHDVSCSLAGVLHRGFSNALAAASSCNLRRRF